MTLTHFFRYGLSTVKQLTQLPRQAHKIARLEMRVDALADQASELSSQIEHMASSTKSNTRLLQSLDDRLTSISNAQQAAIQPQIAQQVTVNSTMSDNHLLDLFYKKFEDKFRGTEKQIADKLVEHLPTLETLSKSARKKQIVDIGCGRGEFLDFAKKHGFKATGVDMNKSMVDRANELGFSAVESDARSYLMEQKTNSLAAITGFHVVEHIPFESLLKLFEQCYRTIDHGGLVLFETPNPENLAIGACNFYMDPSHIHPIPPELLAFALESVGFQVEILRIHPVKDSIEHTDPVVKDLMGMAYGPRDYAVVGRKA